jgi:hypothetical protein
MSKQYNKAEKRKRRNRYLTRKKDTARAKRKTAAPAQTAPATA